ncbi:MAG TPA: PQQ-dependent sugar dehydrogenase [Thermoanaerobaculia bacterium]|jgi:glucose/arabinose dehydrogenase|nr:PQQ-dependent sugar dehydrogenase [Thermoanaerobaculia bacterium]
MRRSAAAAAGIAALLAACSRSAPAATEPLRVTTRSGAVLVVSTFVTGLEVPWSMAFTSPDRLLVTERPGRVRVVEKGRLLETPLAVLKDVEASGESGLMGIALAPDYARSRELTLCYAYDANGGAAVRVSRFRDGGNALSDPKVLVQGIPAARFHAGCRLRFGPDAKLYVTTGDATTGRIAQDLASLGGKTLRLNPDGSIPSDNPFPGSPVFSYGHRNSQGLDWDPKSGLLVETEHGPSGFDGPGGGDEVNIVEAGKNYGWPVVHHRASHEGMVSPILEYTPAVAPSGASFSRGDLLPTFRGDFFFATLRGERLIRVRFDPANPRRVAETEELLRGVYGRLRDVVSGPDGALYVATSNRDGRGRPRPGDDRILRIVEAPPVK